MPYQVLPRRARVDLGAIAMKDCSVFPKSLEPHCLVSYPGHSYPADLANLSKFLIAKSS